MPDDLKDKKIAYRASEGFRKRLQIAAIERGIKVQGLIDAAVEAFLSKELSSAVELPSGPGRLGTLSTAEQNFLRTMLDFYRVADEASIKLVRQHAAAMLELAGTKRQARRTG
jgi:hypothetical protein